MSAIPPFNGNGPLLGSAYLASTTPGTQPTSSSSSSSSTSTNAGSTTRLTPSLCSRYSAFKQLLAKSRATTDDLIIVRLNRASALQRQLGSSSSSSSTTTTTSPASECDVLWPELQRAWNERDRAVEFCEDVLDRQVVQDQQQQQQQQRRAALDGPSSNGGVTMPIETGLDRNLRRRTAQGRGRYDDDVSAASDSLLQGRGESESQVKRRLLHSERSVEEVLRARTLAVFRARCPDHEPSYERAQQMDQERDAARVRARATDQAEGEGRRGRDGRGGVRWSG